MIERPTFQSLALFLSVVENGTMTAAAEIEHVAQPAISVHVRNLERFYGAPLLERSGRRVRPTATGELVADYTRRILGLVDDLGMAVGDLEGLRSGRLVIGASATVAETWLPGMLGRFRQIHPGIALEVHIGNSERVLDDVRERRIGLGVVGRTDPGDVLASRPVFDDTLQLFVSSGSPLASRRTVRLDDLAREMFVFREPGSATRQFMLGCLAAQGFEPAETVQLGSNEAVKRAVASGLGVGILSSQTLDVDVRAGDVVILPCDDWDCRRSFWLVWRSDRAQSRAEQAFVDMC
jgi:LysR family transcriptional regulator, low CO2-responsive transcriptional regulator